MSTRYTPADVATWCSGTVLQGSPLDKLTGLTIDTRSIAPRQLFAAIVGPNHDAHEYLSQAADAGAGCLLINADRESKLSDVAELPVVAVADTTRGIGDLAAGHRRRFEGTVIGLTGSSGKTTTKEMTASVLEAAGPCLKTRGNLNNDYGVPLTLMSREDRHQRAVIEMGMNHRGEIARLAEIAQPDVGLVTNVGTAHIEFLGSQSEIAAEKGDLFAALPAEGIAVANWDDKHVREQSRRARGEVLSFGIAPEAAVRAVDVRFDPEGVFRFTLVTPKGQLEVDVSGLGETTIINALAAAAVGVACGLEPELVARGLANYRGVPGRMSKRILDHDITLIDDSYNANPQSMRASISSLASLKGKGRAVAVLGPMGELGEDAEQAHLDAGKQTFEAGTELLVTLGDGARGIAEGAIAAGMAKHQVHCCDSHEAAVDVLTSSMREGDWVLVKGSRAAHMERIVELLSSEEPR
ncbi:MAG: UDP-N-acetylmuramoyl-tripeptide--D-alanyl-D-alanine ligase [Deltaproteobacteria bacterium]|nr:UDP-N-acetylmuramoyl-tripeptide--D-alanyl-D-alanine ligase [Deltaproteobacteria bacterium]